MTFCECGARLDVWQQAARLCPRCLFQLAIDSNASSADHSDPAHDVQIVGPLGEGPRSIVYLGVRGRERTLVTVKLIHEALAADRFCERISEIASRLRSTSNASFQSLIGAGVTPDGQVYVVARYVPGVAITDYVAAHRSSALDRARLAGDVCAMVESLHAGHIVHGSIKARNVLVAEGPDGPSPVLLDIGVAGVIEEARHRVSSRSDAIRVDISALTKLLLDFLERPPTTLLEDVGSAAALAKLFRR